MSDLELEVLEVVVGTSLLVVSKNESLEDCHSTRLAGKIQGLFEDILQARNFLKKKSSAAWLIYKPKPVLTLFLRVSFYSYRVML